MRLTFGYALMGMAALALSACTTVPTSHAGSAAPPGTPPPAAVAAATIADATLPPPSEISPLSKTIVDDIAIIRAFQAVDIAATAADTILALKPTFRGTPAARRLADAIDGTRMWLNLASTAQRAGQAANYRTALEQASAALAGAKSALADLKVLR